MINQAEIFSSENRIDQYILEYQRIGIRTKEAENLLKHRKLAIDYLQKPDVAVEKMSMQELKILEKSIVNSIDKSFSDQYLDRITKRKYTILV